MPAVDYVVVSNLIIDDLIFADQESHIGILGGAGIYAAAGMRIWAEKIGIVSGVGDDFGDLFGDWMRRNQVDDEGLSARAKNTPRSWVRYETADLRTEEPQFGSEHFHRMEPNMGDIPVAYQSAEGIYIFRDANPEFWRDALTYREQHQPIMMWETHSGAADPAQWSQVAEILAEIDLFSINHAEAQILCGLDDPMAITEKLLSTGVHAVVMRMGSEGTIVADQNKTCQIPIIPIEVIDVTGAGNAFTGGFLVGYCESKHDIVTAGKYGAVSASMMLEQFGPPADLAESMHNKAQARLAQLTQVTPC